MDHIPLLHSSQTFPFIEFLEKNGCPTERLLQQARLPLALLDRADGYIPEKQLWRLLDITSRSECLNDFGLRVGQSINITELLGGLMPQLTKQPTLHSLLKTFCQLVHEESSDAQFWLATLENSKQHWFCRGGVLNIDVGKRDAELYTLLLMIELVRLGTCPGWQPKNIWLQTAIDKDLDNWELFNSANVKFGQQMTAIEIPSYVENSLANHCNLNCCSNLPSTGKVQKKLYPEKDFTGSLSQILELYLRDENTDIDKIAGLLGTSARTLQRRLAKDGIGYSQLVDRIRFKTALPLLKDNNYKLIDVAYDLGYSDPAHFSRAFKRWAGVSPREYRRQFAI